MKYTTREFWWVLAAGAVATSGCLDRSVAVGQPRLASGYETTLRNDQIRDVDLLFEIDNSNSMSENQANLARNFRTLVDGLVAPPRVRDPVTGAEVASFPAVRSLHLGVISSDLGTPGTTVGSCNDTNLGDDGLLNPVRNGRAMRAHQPWTTASAGRRPARCTQDPNQYPSFLRFDAETTNADEFRDDFVCNAFLSTAGCGLEQQLEAAYRALVVHNPRATAGNTDPNAGFVRPEAVLAIVLVTDEEDGSVRNCAYAEPGVPCTDAIDVYDSQSSAWSSTDLNARFYMYATGSAQDPTWPLDRYVDPRNPNRGFTSLKPGHPERVIFSAIAGVPLRLPTRMIGSRTTVDYAALLGARSDGADGLAAMTPEGSVSMRQRNVDPACTNRVVPACRREGSTPTGSCDAAQQYFALPSRRIAEVVRRFDETWETGTLSSICANDYSIALSQIVDRVRERLVGRCLVRPIETDPPVCTPGRETAGCARAGTVVRANCVIRELLPPGVTVAQACTAARGRSPGDRDATTGRATCLVNQVPIALGGAPPSGSQGFFYDTRPDPTAPECPRHIEFTREAAVWPGAEVRLACVQANFTGALAGETM